MSPARELREAVSLRREWITEHLQRHPPSGLGGGPLLDGVWEYLRRDGKCLRGAVCLLSCGLFGGGETAALPVASAVEVFHAWTLVHDDIVDRDSTRRGGPTLHRYFERQARAGHDAPWYGLSLALLAGDIEQAWATELICGLQGPAEVSLRVLRELSGVAVPQLVEGEVLDIELSGTPFAEIRQDEVLRMIERKTAVLYRFAGRAGAWIGRGSAAEAPEVEALAAFLTEIGVAFQLKDDVLGVTSSAEKTGKDSDSDIREGKRTLIAVLAFERANGKERRLLETTLGNAQADAAGVQAVREVFQNTGAVAAVEELAQLKVDEALLRLAHLPDRPQRDLLQKLALYLVQREK